MSRHTGFYTIVLSVAIAMMPSCKTPKQPISDEDTPQYFRITDSADCRIAEVYDPWHDGKMMHRYVISQPLNRVAVTSATHVGFLNALGRLDVISAMTTPKMMYNQPQQAVENIGEDINLNIERILLNHPQAVFITSYGQDMASLNPLREAGIEVIEMVEWMEHSPIARAEWLRFIAAFIGENEKADSVLTGVKEHYHQLASIAADYSDETERSVLSGASYRGTWYVPSGSTFMGRFFRDAGVSYAYENEVTDGSIPLTMEKAIRVFSDADVWLGCSATSRDELKTMDEKHSWFKAYQQNAVFHFSRRVTEDGANDFWETGIVRPDYILSDIIWAVYPNRIPQYSPHFIGRVE